MAIIKGKKYTNYLDIHNERYANDPEYRKGYDALEVEYALYGELIRMRIEKKMTQKQLAKKLGTHQSSIARFEAGTYNPSFDFVKRLVSALGMRLKIVR